MHKQVTVKVANYLKNTIDSRHLSIMKTIDISSHLSFHTKTVSFRHDGKYIVT
jgi:hypothetical protein